MDWFCWWSESLPEELSLSSKSRPRGPSVPWSISYCLSNGNQIEMRKSCHVYKMLDIKKADRAAVRPSSSTRAAPIPCFAIISLDGRSKYCPAIAWEVIQCDKTPRKVGEAFVEVSHVVNQRIHQYRDSHSATSEQNTISPFKKSSLYTAWRLAAVNNVRDTNKKPSCCKCTVVGPQMAWSHLLIQFFKVNLRWMESGYAFSAIVRPGNVGAAVIVGVGSSGLLSVWWGSESWLPRPRVYLWDDEEGFYCLYHNLLINLFLQIIDGSLNQIVTMVIINFEIILKKTKEVPSSGNVAVLERVSSGRWR